MINERKRKVLEAVILDYVLTAEPVGSRTIARKYMPNLSSATIRNEMSDLEELGYLVQPHVSAGRVPNVHAYRLYVDFLIAGGHIRQIRPDDTRRALAARMQQMEDVVYSLAQALSEMTRYTTVVMMPRQGELKVQTLQLIPMSVATALLVIVTDSGIIKDSVVHVSERLTADGLYHISRTLTEMLQGKSLLEVQAMLRTYAHQSGGDPRVLMGIVELAEQIQKQNAADNLMVCGSQNILHHPEYADVDKARRFLSVLEEKERLLHLMRRGGQSGLAAYIGPEIGISDLTDCSVCTASYEVGNGLRGTVGIIGPTRMPYHDILSTLSSTADMLSRILKREVTP